MNSTCFRRLRRLAHGLGLLLSLCLGACLDINEPLIDLELPICTSLELREQYLRGEGASKLHELRGLWSIQIKRCIFKSDKVVRSDLRWRELNSRPFIIDLDQQEEKVELITLPVDPNESAPIITAEEIGTKALISQLLVRLGERPYNSMLMLYELRIEGGRELLGSPNERARYQSDFEVITGTVYEPSQGQVGVFSLTQHPLSDAEDLGP